MKRLSATRKAIVTAVFIASVVSLVYGYFSDADWWFTVGKYGILGFLGLFAALIFPYWGSDPKLGPEIV